MNDVYFFTVYNENGELTLFYPKLFCFNSYDEAIDSYNKHKLEENHIIGVGCFNLKYHNLFDF